MRKFFTFQDKTILVENDSCWETTLIIQLLDEDDEEQTADLWLEPLWNVDEPFETYKEKFSQGDYFQFSFSTEPQQIGLGTLLHKFLKEHRQELGIQTIYSTNEKEDDKTISTAALAFWESKVKKNEAVYCPDLQRFKMIY